MAYKGAQQDEKPITRTQYARLIGVSPAYVSRLIHQGKIPTTPEGLVLPSEADAARIVHRDPSRSHLVKSRLADAERAAEAPNTAAYQKARTEKMQYAAKLAELEFERARGELLDKQETLAAFYALCRQARDRLLQIEVRLPPLLAGKRSKEEIGRIIGAEVRAALEDLSEANLEAILE